MSFKTILYVLALLASVSSTSAQLPSINFDFANATSGVIDELGVALSNVQCAEDTRAESQCNKAPFSGTYVCREFGTLFGSSVKRSICATNIVQGLTLGLSTDTCGPCPDTAPQVCQCACGDNKVMVKGTFFFGRVNLNRCVTNGLSQHMTAWGGAVSCDDGCTTAAEGNTAAEEEP
ncbi:expressed unknown protein [Seminavis robusta]|uniref:Cyanovirin-N domain-containing protein n=1 Tax=Seminavis robusta TaxID=568900 RepID=A0A9N8EDA3_9STRA|nr:expressed unknown protein [Seminavis robusta]|eukprot:Sro834_g208700.1 n/a (177) ;mRNA; f:23977-24507